MPDTDSLRPYKRTDAPIIAGSEQFYIIDQLKSIEISLGTVISAMKRLEARMIAHGI